MTATTTPPRRTGARASRRQPIRDRIGLRRSGPWTTDALALLVLVTVLTGFGLVMALSASFATDAVGGGAFTTFTDQATFAAIGLVLYGVAAGVDHRVWRWLSWPMLVVAVVGLVMVVLPGVGLERNGATRWIAVGPYEVQPTELAKLATALWLADVTARKRELWPSGPLPTKHLLVPALPLFGVLAVLVMLEPDLGTTLLLALIVFLGLWFEGVPLRILVGLGGVTLVATVVAISTAGYRLARIRGWLDPEGDPAVAGYQLLQSLYALGSGGVLGTGLGESRGKWAFIPNPETDFIFAIIGEELGLLGALLVLGLFTGLLVVGIRVARTTTDRFGRVVAGVLTAWLVGQAFLNIGTVTGLLPITGVTLPLVSVGGSSLVSTLVALGILTSIARARPSGGTSTTPTSGSHR